MKIIFYGNRINFTLPVRKNKKIFNFPTNGRTPFAPTGGTTPFESLFLLLDMINRIFRILILTH